MAERIRYSSGAVARYLTDRMIPGRSGRRAAAGEGSAQRSTAMEEGLSVAEIERRVAELSDLVLEKEDLLKQTVSDECMLNGLEGSSISQETIIRALDDLGAGSAPDLRGLARKISSTQGLESSIEQARNRLSGIRGRIERLIVHPQVREAYERQIEESLEVIRSARNIETLRKLIDKSLLARMELLARRSSADVTLTGPDNETIRKYEIIQRKAEEHIEELMTYDEVYYETKRRCLLEYRRQLFNGGFVETESVKNEVMKILSHLRLGIPVFLRGHLGSGKTEIALHVSRAYFGCEPEFISGSEEATKYDIYGKTQIGIIPEADKIREFRSRIEEYRRMNSDLREEQLRDVEKQYYETIVVRGQATSFFQYGPLVRAMKHGKPLVIDEMDGIPHSILMRLNHVLTRRAGDKVRIEENGGDEISVKKGFCVLATGNVKSARYKREELDAAFLSRWWSNDITYPPQKETYEILISSLVDRRGNLQARSHNDLEDVKKLTLAAVEIQRIFMGEHLDYLGEGADAARGRAASLMKSVLSLRHLWNIVRPWKARNFDKPIEHYILSEFIRPAVSEDQVYLVQLLCRFRFFRGWKAEQFEIPGLSAAKLSAFQGKPLE
jgi:MoxR-like ATPase